MNSITDAQLDMRAAYYGGAPGIIVSGTAWLAAAVVAYAIDAQTAILTLVFGGMLIFPVSVLLCKAIGCSGKHQKDNPLASVAIAGTIWMVLSIPIAAGASLFRIEWFFPAMLLVIGSRYLTFPTLYGIRMYWLFGAVLIVAGMALAVLRVSVSWGALTGALVEYAFGAAIFLTHKSTRGATSTQ